MIDKLFYYVIATTNIASHAVMTHVNLVHEMKAFDWWKNVGKRKFLISSSCPLEEDKKQKLEIWAPEDCRSILVKWAPEDQNYFGKLVLRIL